MGDVDIACHPLLPAEAMGGPLQDGMLPGKAPQTQVLSYPHKRRGQCEQDRDYECGRDGTGIGEYIRHAPSPFLIRTRCVY